MGDRGFSFAGAIRVCLRRRIRSGHHVAGPGTVQDSSGAVVPDASVKLVNEGTRVTFETTTSAAGAYAFEAVQPGTYRLDVEASGFRKFISRNNVVTIGQPTTVNVKLEVGHHGRYRGRQSRPKPCRPAPPATTAT